MIKVYEYAGCSTCKRALKFLTQKQIQFEKIPIVDEPPSPAELKKMLTYIRARGGDFKKLFNVSGQLYREMGIAQKLKDGMTEAQAIALLSKNGKLIKRPFILAKDGGEVGFSEEAWSRLL